MLVFDFFKWWYGVGWRQRVFYINQHLSKWVDYFSIGLLLKTMFSPWRQNISYARSDQSLQTKFRAMVDNIISRFVGFMVRLIVLMASSFTILFVLVFNTLLVLLWPFVPFLPLIVIVIGLSL